MARNPQPQIVRARLRAVLSEVSLLVAEIERDVLRIENSQLRDQLGVKDDVMAMMKERDRCHECGCRFWEN